MPQSIRLPQNQKRTYAPTWLAEEFMVPLLGSKIEELISTYALPSAQDKVLDVGCGGQPFRAYLESIGYTYTGFDVSQNSEGTVQILGAIDASLPSELLELSPFHFILCTEVMEHVADWKTSFHNMASLLAPGGRLLMTTPHFYPLHEEPYDFWRPTLHALRHFGSQVGLQEMYSSPVGDTWDVLGTLLGEVIAAGKTSAVHNRWEERIAAKFVRFAAKQLFNILHSHRLQKVVSLQSRIYLSNVIMFEKAS